ncbi:serine protease [Streptomyces cinnabarinus]|uniref:Serine protease n=1 Tax=Streptomyces cinnabarinus TaxID=67287 RepID=A0ABY7KG18_9ACTN|nr:trypsin-like peptidase domain-containing protein [Streptomyces cinnabarinus]WAZ22535.1 serine protease [Streptomyces cinnabarinus]
MGADRGPGRHGSGYRVGDRWVLTSAHLVSEARVTVVWVAPGHGDRMWAAPAEVALASGKADVALLEITGQVHDDCAPPAYGAVPRTAATLPITVMGHLGLDTHDAFCTGGTISVRTDPRGGALELAIGSVDRGPRPDRSPWERMAGAAVWHDDTLIGLVGPHRRTDALGRLAAVRVERWYELLTDAQLRLLHRHAGLPTTPAGLTHIPVPAPDPDGPVSLADLPETLPLRELDGLVTALTLLPSVSDRNGLTLILDSIDPVISAMSPRSPALRPDVFGILRTCLRYRGTLDQLLEAIRLVEGESVGVVRMDQEAVELSRRHR